MRPSPAMFAVLSVAVAGLVASGIWLLGLESDCRARWGSSGFEHRYDARAGCQVLAGSRWLPEKSVTVHATGSCSPHQ
jgi:hypothetical protein